MPSRPPPRPRAIADLSQLPDASLFVELATGMALVHEHVLELERGAAAAFEAENIRAGRVLEVIAAEEAAKYLILLDAARCPRHPPNALAFHLSKFVDHLARLLYVEACDWQPARFGELRAGIGSERASHYLDGPNDVDWIFTNQLKADRERAVYVDYVRDDDRHRWHSPIKEDRLLGPLAVRYVRRHAVELMDAFHTVGVATPGGLEFIAASWRAFVVDDDTHVEQLRERISATLDGLQRAGLIAPAPASLDTILNCWPFPLHGLDLRELEVSVPVLRQHQEGWTPP